jgi:hypothetical protein
LFGFANNARPPGLFGFGNNARPTGLFGFATNARPPGPTLMTDGQDVEQQFKWWLTLELSQCLSSFKS